MVRNVATNIPAPSSGSLQADIVMAETLSLLSLIRLSVREYKTDLLSFDI